VKPWLGERAGIFFTSFTDSPSGAIVMATTDADKAWKALRKEIRLPDDGEEPKVESRSYHGVAYDVVEDGSEASAVVRGFAVAGDEAGVKQVIDTRAAASLARSPEYRQSRAKSLGDTHLVTAYVDFPRLIGAIGKSSGLSSDDIVFFRQLVDSVSLRSLGLGLVVDATKLALDSETVSTKPVPADRSAAPDVGSVPGDAWLALSAGDLGTSIGDELDQLETVAAFGGDDVERALRELRTAYGLDVRRDLLSWMGSGTFFIRGTSLPTLSGAIVIDSRNSGRSRAAVAKLARVFRRIGGFSVEGVRQAGVDAGIAVTSRELPIRVHFAAAGDRFVIAVTDAALRDALKPPTTLSQAPGFRRAKEALGERSDAPQFFLDTQKLISLLEGFGLDTDSTYRQVKPYLNVLGPLVVSATAIDARREQRDGQLTRIALVLR
jgi:Protein of unknown function (DUF3352)